MTRKLFNAHVGAAREQLIDHVTNIKHGESEGEVVFTYSNEALPGSVQVRILGGKF
jgi:hypothetical protein